MDCGEARFTEDSADRIDETGSLAHKPSQKRCLSSRSPFKKSLSEPRARFNRKSIISDRSRRLIPGPAGLTNSD